MPKRLRNGSHAAALAGYVFLAILYTFPLITRLGTHALGSPTADVPYWLWYLWQFRHAVTELHTNPLWSDMIYWPHGANLLFNHGIFYAIQGFFLQPAVGLVASYNLSILQTLVLSGYGIFLIAWEWGAGRACAFVAGVLYAFSTYSTDWLMVQATLDHTSGQAVVFFVWALSRLWRRRGFWDAGLAALMLTWVWGCDYYYFLICGLLTLFFYLILDQPAAMEFTRRGSTPALRAAARVLEAALALDLVWLGRSLSGNGQIEFHGSGSTATVFLYVAPYLAFWALLAGRLALNHRARIALKREAVNLKTWAPYLWMAGCYAALNLPLIWAMLNFFLSGDAPGGNARPWRGGGNPTDLALYILPSPYHPLWNAVCGPWLRRIGGFHTWCPSFLAVAMAFWFWRQKPKDIWVRLWFAGALFSFLLTLGPWLKIFGFHTYLLLPFYFVHLLPVFNHMQVGNLFQPFTNVFLALIFAAALKALQDRARPGLGKWLPLGAFCVLAFELAHIGIPSVEVKPSPLYGRLSRLPEGVLLEVPLGALFDGMGAHGDIGTGSTLGNYRQIFHRKPIMGGANGRMPRYVYERMSTDSFIAPLVAAQKGRPPPARLRDSHFVARYFRQNHVRYVLVRSRDIPSSLEAVIKKWPVRLIDEDPAEALKLYQVQGPAA